MFRFTWQQLYSHNYVFSHSVFIYPFPDSVSNKWSIIFGVQHIEYFYVPAMLQNTHSLSQSATPIAYT
jgi:hypothetical protein